MMHHQNSAVTQLAPHRQERKAGRAHAQAPLGEKREPPPPPSPPKTIDNDAGGVASPPTLIGPNPDRGRYPQGADIVRRAVFVASALAAFACVVLVRDVRVRAYRPPGSSESAHRAAGEVGIPPALSDRGTHDREFGGGDGDGDGDGDGVCAGSDTCASPAYLRGMALRRNATDVPPPAAAATAAAAAAAASDSTDAGRAPSPPPPLRPRPVVVAGPSGVGKGTLIGMLMERYAAPGNRTSEGGGGGSGSLGGGDYFGFSVSHTTRAPRPGEVDGVHYHFARREDMERDIEAGLFAEHAEVHGNLYGTSYEAVRTVTESGRICVLDIDVQGVRGVRGSGRLDPRYIFVAPPSMEELEKRLRGRGTETEEAIRVRTANAAREVEYGTTPGNFDAVVVNKDKDAALGELVEILEGWYPHLRQFTKEHDQI